MLLLRLRLCMGRQWVDGGKFCWRKRPDGGGCVAMSATKLLAMAAFLPVHSAFICLLFHCSAVNLCFITAVGPDSLRSFFNCFQVHVDVCQGLLFH